MTLSRRSAFQSRWVFLVWHLVQPSQMLTRHNDALLNELARIRESVARDPTIEAYHERVQRANEHLIAVMDRKERETLKLIGQIVDTKLPPPNGSA